MLSQGSVSAKYPEQRTISLLLVSIAHQSLKNITVDLQGLLTVNYSFQTANYS